MRIIIEGKAGHGDIVIFGKNFGWLRSATTIKGRRTGFRTVLDSSNAYAARVAIPGPVDGQLSASVSDSGADLVMKIVVDNSESVVWEFNKHIGPEPVPFKFKVGQFSIEGSVRLEP